MKIKQPQTIEKQIEILKSRNLKIEDEAFAESVLQYSNYYVLSGYLYQFLKNNSYSDDISFNKIYKIFICDKRIKSIILYGIDIIEQNLKTVFAYNLSLQFGPLCYTDHKNFTNLNEHRIMLDKFNKAINRNKKLPFVSHHIKKYNNNFPIWVAFELFTFGMLYNFYKNSTTSIKKMLSKCLGTGPVQLESWMDCILHLRNLCAHYMRLYDVSFQKTVKLDKLNFKNFTYTHKVFDILFVIKLLFPNKNEWNNYIIPAIKQILDEFSDSINLDSYGFDNNWENKLTIH